MARAIANIPWLVSQSRVGGIWDEDAFIRLAAPHCLIECVVEFKDDAFGAIVTPLGFVLALHNGESVEYVVHGVARGGEFAR